MSSVSASSNASSDDVKENTYDVAKLQLIQLLEKESAKHPSRKSFNKMLKSAVKDFINSTHNEEEYAKSHQCEPGKELTRIAYVYEPKRVVAISMTYNNDGQISYGASIFRREEGEVFQTKQKTNIRKTAELRHKKNPVKFQLDVSKIGYDSRRRLNFSKVIKQVRKHIGTYGVKYHPDGIKKNSAIKDVPSAETNTENKVIYIVCKDT